VLDTAGSPVALPRRGPLRVARRRTFIRKDLVGDAPNAVALSADGNQLAVLAGQTITLWNVTALAARQVWISRWYSPGSSFLAFTPDQKRIAILGRIRLPCWMPRPGATPS